MKVGFESSFTGIDDFYNPREINIESKVTLHGLTGVATKHTYQLIFKEGMLERFVIDLQKEVKCVNS
jgi:hypothetical protein